MPAAAAGSVPEALGSREQRAAGDRGPSRFAAGAFLAWCLVTAVWWALAFAPLPLPGDALARFRSVCFGTLPSGLPDTYGWVLLMLAPASILVFLLAVWGPDLAATVRRLLHSAPGRAALLALVALLAAGGLWAGARVAAGVAAGAVSFAPEAAGAVDGLPPGYPRTFDEAPPLPLVDQHGERLDLAALSGRPVFVTFAYAHCTTVCPVLVDTVKRARAEAAAVEPAILIVTLDPWRDTPASLPALAATWGLGEVEGARLLSGSVDEVTAALAAWKVDFSRDTQNGEVAHPALAYVLDAEGRIAYRFLNPPARWMAEAAARLARAGTA